MTSKSPASERKTADETAQTQTETYSSCLASSQVFAEGSGRSRLVWITDVLPDELVARLGELVEQGAGVMKQTLEKEAACREPTGQSINARPFGQNEAR